MRNGRGCGNLVPCRGEHRGVAQPGSAPALGAGGPRFEPGRPDQFRPPDAEAAPPPRRSPSLPGSASRAGRHFASSALRPRATASRSGSASPPDLGLRRAPNQPCRSPHCSTANPPRPPSSPAAPMGAQPTRQESAPFHGANSYLKKATPCQESEAGSSQRPARTCSTFVSVLSKTTVRGLTSPLSARSANRSRDTLAMPASSR